MKSKNWVLGIAPVAGMLSYGTNGEAHQSTTSRVSKKLHKKDTERPALILAGALSLAVAWTLTSSPALGHGSMEVPTSRVYNCFLEGPESPQSDACTAAVREGGTQALYDWNGVNRLEANSQHRAIVPDGRLCSGGKESHKGLDLPRSDWATTTISPNNRGRFEFIFRGTAPHATKDWIFYVTRDSYDPTLPLLWDDLEAQPFCELGNVELTGGRYKLDCPLPNKNGKHVIYNIWQRSDSTEAFYTCIDVVFAEPGIVDWRPLGQVRAVNDLPTGSAVTLRLFNSSGGDAASHTLDIEDETLANQWPFELADLVNRESHLVQIGVLDEFGEISPVNQAQGNTVYTDVEEALSFQLDISLPDDDTGGGNSGNGDTGGGNTGGEDTGSWQASAVYTAGAQVTHRGQKYTAKWWTQGFVPDSPVANEWDSPWDPAVLEGQTGGDGNSPSWRSDIAYTAGQTVSHNGQGYEAKWWSRGFAPDTPVANEWDTPWRTLP
ncbi:MAG: lytic polysaccharide monooxygenase [Pseudomonadota bacterium]